MPNHFGVKVLEGKCGLKIMRENYVVVSNKNSLRKLELIRKRFNNLLY